MQDELRIAARWDTHENLLGHLRSEVYKKLLLLMEFSTTPPVLEFFAVREFRGLDLVETARSVPS